MPKVHIALQEGFDTDTVIVEVDGEVAFNRAGVRTRLQTGFADSFEAEIPELPAKVCVRLPLRDQTASLVVKGDGTGAAVTFYGEGMVNRTRVFDFKSPYARTVEFEFDRVDGGHNARWSDMELHDAMQKYWSLFDDRPAWSMWVLFAALHEQGDNLGGIMFDDVGPNHRQGTALFNDSFISRAPTGDPSPQAWASRMRFWTARHEMGHAFNLAHSWQKSLTAGGRGPWIPIANEPEARSFMNYPFSVNGGQRAFFADFDYRFSDSELTFMRHAPARFVQMGNADWFDHHGFQQANTSPESALQLEVRANRTQPIYEFLEPENLELKLTNVSAQPVVIDEQALSSADHMTVIVKRDGRPARQYVPYADYCWTSTKTTLNPGESLYQSRFISAGRNGYDLAEPGYYTTQVCLHLDGEDIVSNPLRLRVAPPRSFEEEYIAQDFFTEDVGRILTFDGSYYLQNGNDTLREIIEKLPDRRVAVHAAVAVANPISHDFKRLDINRGGPTLRPAGALGGAFTVTRAKPDEARRTLETALTRNMHTAAETLGHIDYLYYAERFIGWLDEQGDGEAASRVQQELLNVLTQRRVLPSVIDGVKEKLAEYKKVHYIQHKPKAA